MRLTLLLFFTFYNHVNAQQIFNQKLNLMGSDFEITVVAKNQTEANQFINCASPEITRIEKIISSWDVHSETSKINRNSGIQPVAVSLELFQLIERAIQISKLTDGAFDISYASMDNIWKFDGSMTQFPMEDAIQKSIEKVGYKNIILDQKNTTVFLKIKGMKIGFGGIGKGYAADKAKKTLIKKGVSSGIINASGDMNTWGKQPNGEEWKVAITNPLGKNKAFALLPISNSAVVTSGDYERFVVFDGKRFSHIIDPRTGYPANGIISVSVFSKKAELADALATAIFVMGTEIGLDRINQLPEIECIIIDQKGGIHVSKNIKIN